MIPRVETRRDVIAWSLMITGLAVAVPTAIVYIFAWRLPLRFMIQVMVPAAAIPLLIALPISLFALHLLRLLTTTIN